MPDRAAPPVAPAPELEEPTPEMIAAGAEIIWRAFDETIPYGSSFGEHVAAEVFRAMARRRHEVTEQAQENSPLEYRSI